MIKISYNPTIDLTDFDAKVKTVCSNVDKFCKNGYCGNGAKIKIATAIARYNAMDATAQATFDRYAGANWRQLAEVKMPKFLFCQETLDVLKFFNDNNRLPKQSVKEEKSLYDWCGQVWRNDRNLAEKFPDVYAKIKELKGQK